jgi:VIT1/CCC1 family predicted Fe2+/Mn2+ transporter
MTDVNEVEIDVVVHPSSGAPETSSGEQTTGGPSRDLGAAKKAFSAKDMAASRKAHEMKAQRKGKAKAKAVADGEADAGQIVAATEVHGGAGSEYIKSIVFGGLDGIVTTFAVVAASFGADLDTDILLLMGFASLIADGISMGFGDFLSSKAEMDYVLHEKAREEWELENYKEGEIKEMVEIYEERGMTTEDATTVMNIFAKHPKLFVDLMLVDELGLMPPDLEESAAKKGLVTFVSFIFFGAIPLWFYLIFYSVDIDNGAMFAIASVATAFAMFLLGAVKAKFVNQTWYISGLGMLGNGVFAAISAYLVGLGLAEAFGIDHGGSAA